MAQRLFLEQQEAVINGMVWPLMACAGRRAGVQPESLPLWRELGRGRRILAVPSRQCERRRQNLPRGSPGIPAGPRVELVPLCRLFTRRSSGFVVACVGWRMRTASRQRRIPPPPAAASSFSPTAPMVSHAEAKPDGVNRARRPEPKSSPNVGRGIARTDYNVITM